MGVSAEKRRLFQRLLYCLTLLAYYLKNNGLAVAERFGRSVTGRRFCSGPQKDQCLEFQP